MALRRLSGRGVTAARGKRFVTFVVVAFRNTQHWEHDGECPVELHRTRSARQLAPGGRKLGCFTPFCRRRLESVANAVGTTCRGFESHQLHFPPMRNRTIFGAVAQRVEQYRFTILVATIWNDRLKAEL